MNRRQLLQLVLGATTATCLAEAAADCRDDRGMIKPLYSDECVELTITPFEAHFSDYPGFIGRGLFGYDSYEELVKCQKEKRKFWFEYDGTRYGMFVSRLTIDVNRQHGCVLCEVEGRLWYG